MTIPSDTPRKSTDTLCALLYLRAFCSASWTIRNRHKRQVGRERRRNVLVRERDGHVGLGQLALKSVESLHQTHQPQPGRMEAVREIVHARGDFLGALHRFSGDGFGMALNRPTQQLEVDLQHRQLLADVVVQLPRDPRTLSFLRIQQPGPEIANPLVTLAQEPPDFDALLARPLVVSPV